MRHGLGLGVAGTAGTRATLDVEIGLSGEAIGGGPVAATVARTVQLYGPGDVVGIDGRAVVACEPRAGAANFEANHLPYVAFYDEDFPWRYTPAAPAGDRLVPWITLAVLREEEFEDVAGGAAGRASIAVADPVSTLPPTDQLHLWAHVQVTNRLAAPVVSADAPGLATALGAQVAADPDRAHSRLLAPRKLTPNTGYHAFVVPTFESGRLAGLGLDPAGVPEAAALAWPGAGGRLELPVYLRWHFRTAEVGDFEYLVRLLKPRRPDARVGRRPLDVLAPGSALPPIDVPGLGGVLQLGGALRVPESVLDEDARAEVAAFEDWAGGPPGAHPFQRRLAELVNLTDDFARPDSPLPADPDPVISPPLYGRWHALTNRLLEQPDGTPVEHAANWVHELNLDPRHRAAAGLGTRVVQEGQEAFMAAAWEQVGDVLAANRTIRHNRIGREVSEAWHRRTVRPLTVAAPGRGLQLAGPVLDRVISGETTLSHQVRVSALPAAAVEPALRKTLRARGPVARRAQPLREAVRPGARSDAFAEALVHGLAAGRLSAAPPRAVPAVPTLEAELRAITRRLPPGALDEAGAASLKALRAWPASIAPGEAPADGRRTSLTDSLRTATLRLGVPGAVEILARPAQRDNPASARLKTALRDTERMLGAARDAASRPAPGALAVDAAAAAVVGAIEPAVTFRRRLAKVVSLPPRLAGAQVPGPGDEIDELMAYPVIDLPMYQPLKAISDELFVPNLNLLENNSITLLETNQPFIEAYMVGLNHELGRELLWREYPTDQRGSPFRQFWDVRELVALTDGSEAARDALRDIPPLHTWGATSALGAHDPRDAGGSSEDELVLVIRGELLKRYPNAAIYAHRADWERVNGVIDRARPRRLVEPALDAQGRPERADVRLPLYRAQVDPDIFFVGFDLTEEVALGGSGEQADDPAGWFFVLKERPGEPRFGLDVDSTTPVDDLHAWNELAWSHLPSGDAFLRVSQSISLTSPGEPPTSDAAIQFEEDRQITWSPGTNAGDLAYVLYQVPVLVAVHTAELLRVRP